MVLFISVVGVCLVAQLLVNLYCRDGAKRKTLSFLCRLGIIASCFSFSYIIGAGIVKVNAETLRNFPYIGLVVICVFFLVDGFVLHLKNKTDLELAHKVIMEVAVSTVIIIGLLIYLMMMKFYIQTPTNTYKHSM